MRLRKLQHDVLIVDSLSVNNKFSVTSPHHLAMIEERLHLLGSSQLVVSDARDYHMLSRILGSWTPEVIVHLAAVAHLDRANKDPFSTFDHNLRTLENCLDIAKSIACEHFVYFSSSTVYGDFKVGVYDETAVCDPRGIYGVLKYCGELMVKEYGALFGLPYTVVRPCALYGPRCVSGRVIQRFVEAACAGETLKVDGDGSGKVDFTYIEDLIDGMELVIGNDKAKSEVFNLTAGRARSLNDVVHVLETGFSGLKVEYIPKDAQRPERGTLSVVKAANLLGYCPQYGLERGIRLYVDWHRRFLLKKAA